MTILDLSTDFRNVKLREKDAIKENEKLEFVIKIFCESDRLVRFWSVRRNENEIMERHYSIRDGLPHLDYVGNVPTSSPNYDKINTFLEEVEIQDAARGHMGGIEIKI